ncbi:MAG: DUF3667 domain-containing protein [Ferruginibacter sp.]
MSHLKERSDKDCLNCNARLHGTYCHICGQENIEPKESFWHLVTHFFYDITHFDGKFFSTLKYLIWRPGFLPAEYARGKRASYLNPIRMYVFTSAFFFLIFFSFIQPKEEVVVVKKKKPVSTILKKLEKDRGQQLAELKKENDTTAIRELNRYLKLINDDIDSLKRDSTTLGRLKTYNNNFVMIGLWTDKYPNRRKYDSIQQALPPENRDSYIGRAIKYKTFELNEKYKSNSDGASRALKENFFHHFPQMLFISLPLFALILRLLYVRRKEFYYVNHLIFTLHFYIFTFITMLVIFSLSKMSVMLNWNFLSIVGGVIMMAIFFYLYKSMRNFYGQRRAKTIVKFLALNFLFLFVQIFLSISFFIYSLFLL